MNVHFAIQGQGRAGMQFVGQVCPVEFSLSHTLGLKIAMVVGEGLKVRL
jgi:hypothetical protein